VTPGVVDEPLSIQRRFVGDVRCRTNRPEGGQSNVRNAATSWLPLCLRDSVARGQVAGAERAQNVAFPGVRGNGITSLMLAMPVA
jgi:hypothetical protein